MPAGAAFGGVSEFEIVFVKAGDAADVQAAQLSVGAVKAFSALIVLNARPNA